MTFYLTRLFSNSSRTLKKWTVSVLMAILRGFTGPPIDVIFWVLNLGKKAAVLPPVKNDILMESAVGLAKRVREKQVSCTSVVEAFLQRIDELQPLLNAVVDDRRKEALEEARRIDQLLENGTRTREQLEREFPLLGVPVSIKEAIRVRGMLWTSGFVQRKDIRADEDAEVVHRLKAAGAIPIANTNTSEQCFWIETFNNLYGRTNNPYDTRKTPGGSSGGEGALVAAAGSVLGIGNDIGGSIRYPASYNGIFGHKPSQGIIPNVGAFPVTEEIIQPYIGTGPMCRYASDLCPALKIMAGNKASLLKLDDNVSIPDLKVYYMEDSGGSNFTFAPTDEVKKAVRKVVSHFRTVCIVPPEQIHIQNLRHSFLVWAYSMCAPIIGIATIETRTFGKPSKTKVWKELLLSLIKRSNYSFPILVTILVEKYLSPNDSSVAEPFRRMQHQLIKDFKTLLDSNSVFILPTTPEPAPYHYVNLFRAQNVGLSALFNSLSLPSTNCPVELSKHGMPIGVQVVAGLNNDHLNFAVAREIERQFGGWSCPGSSVKTPSAL